MEIGQLLCNFSFGFQPKKSMYLELQAKYEIFLSELPVVGKDLHLLDGIAIGNINLISDTTGTVLNLDIADRHIRLTLSDNQEQCQMLCTKGIYTGYDAGQEKMQFLWFRMEQRFSCFTIHRLGVGFDGTAIALALDAEFSCQGFRFALDGLGIAIPFQPQNVADFLLSGLSISYQQSGLAIGGGFTHRKGQQGESYDGSIQITAGELSLQAVASYADGSFLAYGILRAGIGGPPAFSVTGLALGFGINQYLKLPSMEQVETYPLVAAALDSSYTADQLLEGIKEQTTPLPGQNFLVVGICFNSFGMADSTALLTVSFGAHLEVGVLGTSVMTAPPMTKTDPIARAQLALAAVFLPESGLFAAQAQLTEGSYILSRNCHLTGDFAFYLWFDGTHKDDFVITLGGYSKKYQKPQHYPDVSRLGFVWRVMSSLVLSGESYCALTPSALYAGGKMEAVFTQGALCAWFTAYTDIALGWKPFFYDFSVGVSLGASITLDFWLFSTTFTLEMSVDLRIWGPEFSGTARVTWWVISFTISFGGNVEPSHTIEWQEFKESFLSTSVAKNAEEEILSVYAEKGGNGSITILEGGKEKTIDAIHPDELVLMVHSKIPVNHISSNEMVLQDEQPFGIPPMGNVTMKSTLDVVVTLHTAQGEQPIPFVAKEIRKNLPKALWQNNATHTDGELLPQCLTGFSLSPVPKEWIPFPRNSFLTLDKLSEYEKTEKQFCFVAETSEKIAGNDKDFSVFQKTAEKIPQLAGAFAQEMEKAGFTFDFTPDLASMANYAESLFEEEFFLSCGG